MDPKQMIKTVFAYLFAGTMYVAILSGAAAFSIATWMHVSKSFHGSALDIAVGITLYAITAVALMALAYIGSKLTRLIFSGLIGDRDK